MAKTYLELIAEQLESGEWIPEGKLLPAVVRKRFGIGRASTKRASGVKSQLANLLSEGKATKGLTKDGKTFWKKGDGGKNEVVVIGDSNTAVTKARSILVQRAQGNIKKLEEFLSSIILRELTSSFGDQWHLQLPPLVFDKLSKQYEKNSYNKWTARNQKNLFDTANIIDYVDIFRHLWHIFKPIFGDKEITVGRLKEIALLRNDIQHNRELKEKEYVYFIYSVELFLEKFSITRS